MTSTPLLSSAFLNNLLAIQNTQKLVDRTTLRLATGQKVNSALDNPQNFFDARSLNNRASDLSRRLDGIGNSIQTINEGLHGLEAIERLLNIGESVVTKELEELRAQGPVVAPPLPPTVPPLSTQILAANPDAYWRLDELAGASASNLGAIGGGVAGTYLNGPTLGAAALYSGGNTSVEFNGVNQGIIIPDNTLINLAPTTQRTVEMVFNANTTAGRQVLYEEGATVNALSIYILNGNLHVTGRDSGAWGPANISIPINAGETYHVAFTLDSTAGDFIGYVNGVEIGRTAVTATFPSHSGDIGIGFMNQANWFHDGALSGNGLYFDGRISDVALYNNALTATEMADHAADVLNSTPASSSDENEEFNEILDQITRITIDANYRGINLLAKDNLNTLFNESGLSALLTKGADFTSTGLGIKRTGFSVESELEKILETLRAAIKEVRQYGHTLVTDLNILTIRDNFTHSAINTLIAGAQDLTQADINAEGANLLATQTRQQLAVASLGSASSNNAGILDLFV